jgi:MFS family permease
MLFVSGIGNTFAVFFPSLLAEFGGSRGATAAAVTLLWGVGAAVGPIAGYLVPRRAPRAIVTAGLVATALGLALAAHAPTLLTFVLALGVGGGLGVGLTGLVVHAALIADTYVQRRGFAMAIVLSGSMAGPVLAGPLQWAIDRVGWRGALVWYIGVIVALVPAALLTYPTRLRTPPRPPAPDDPGVRAIIMSRPFWLLAVTYAIAPAVGIMATVQHTLFFTAHGYSAAQASFLLALGGVLAIGGRALAGIACDAFGAMGTGIASFLVSLVGTACLLALNWTPSWWLVAGYLMFLFAPIGSRAPIIPLLLMRMTSPARYAVVFGYLAISNNLGAAAGPLLSGALYDLTGSYAVVFGTAIVLILVALGALVAFQRALGGRPASTRSGA